MSILLPIVQSTRRLDLVAGVGQTVFTFNLPVFDAADIAVFTRTDPSLAFIEQTGGYTVALIGDGTDGATVTFAAAPRGAGGPDTVVRLDGARIASRTLNVTRGGGVDSAALERELDKVAVTQQELRRDIDDARQALPFGRAPLGRGVDNQWDALDGRIENLGDASLPGDAVNIRAANGLVNRLLAAVAATGVPALSAFAFATAVGLSIARADIPSITIPLTRIIVSGHAAVGDAGDGAPYVRAASGAGAMAIQDASGQWFQLDLTRKYARAAWFGCGLGASDDSAALQALASSGAIFLDFDALTYKFGSAQVNGAANQIWQGKGAATVFLLNAAPAGDMLHFAACASVQVNDIAFDWNNKTPAGANASLSFQSCADLVVQRCRFTNQARYGIGVNACDRFRILDNFFLKNSPDGTVPNEAINVSSFSGACHDGLIRGNRSYGLGFDVAAIATTIEDNIIDGWGFGGGITMEAELDNCHSNRIRNNVIRAGAGKDVNDTIPLGIENWGRWSLIEGNIIYANDGDGIANGGYQCVIVNNIVFNNGLYPHRDEFFDNGRFAGVWTRYGVIDGDVFTGAESIIANNRCFDTGGDTQDYGYGDQSASTAYALLSGNLFKGSARLPAARLGTVSSFAGPALEGVVAWTPGTLADNAVVSTSLTLAGATLGDIVTIAYDKNLQGCLIYGEVSATNAIGLHIKNITGSSKTLTDGNARVRVTKSEDAADY